MNFEFDESVETIQDIFPDEDVEVIRDIFIKCNKNIDSTIRYFQKKEKQPHGKRTQIKIHSDVPQDIVQAIEEAIQTHNSIQVHVTKFAPQCTISVSHNNLPCKPMIYVEPNPIDQQFISSIESQSIILTSKSNDITLKAISNIYNVTLLQLLSENAKTSILHVLSESGIIGEGFIKRKEGLLWKDLLTSIPMISNNYSDVIFNAIPNPYSVIHALPKELYTPKGNKIPQKILDTLKLFFTTLDPNQKIETTPKKK